MGITSISVTITILIYTVHCPINFNFTKFILLFEYLYVSPKNLMLSNCLSHTGERESYFSLEKQQKNFTLWKQMTKILLCFGKQKNIFIVQRCP